MNDIVTPPTEKKTVTKCYKMWHLLVSFGVGVLIAALVLMASGQFFKGATIDLSQMGDIQGDQITDEDLGQYFDPSTGQLTGTIKNITEELSEDVGEIQDTNEEILDQLQKLKALILSLQQD